ncbi:MAG: nitroreductase [Peptococcaceae bacterium BRH_c4b]|nr:MAG: nitroreductase [Peptococcaceae bacterium BRH_c4b]
MDVPFSQWYKAIEYRRSRRQFVPRPLEPELRERMCTVCDEFRPFPETRAVLVSQSPDGVFKGLLGHYGRIKGATAFIAYIGNMDCPNVQEKLGYMGEGIILEATSLGLATCWVGGFFKPEVAAQLAGSAEQEKVLAVTPIGYPKAEWSIEEKLMTGFGRNHQRKPLAELIVNSPDTQFPIWVKSALEAARLAPSAVNRQPWRFTVSADDITISVDNLKDTYHISKRLDCGIAMLHLELAAFCNGLRGTWEFLEAPKVARYYRVRPLTY